MTSAQLVVIPDVRSLSAKQRKALNPTKTGVFAKTVLLPGEDRQELEDHLREYVDYFRPSSGPEMDAVTAVAFQSWREHRLAAGYARKVLLSSEKDPDFRSFMDQAEAVQERLDQHQAVLLHLDKERKKGTVKHAAAARSAAMVVRDRLRLDPWRIRRMADSEIVQLSVDVRAALRSVISEARRQLGELNEQLSRLRKDQSAEWVQLVDRERARILRNKEKALRILFMVRALGPNGTKTPGDQRARTTWPAAQAGENDGA